jgi:hypothetical protein
VLSGTQAIADHGVFADAHQATGLADAAALGEMVQNGDGFVGTQAAIEQRSTFAFGETGLTGFAVEQAALLPAIACTDGEIAVAAFAVVGTVGVVAAESMEILVHGGMPLGWGRDEGATTVAIQLEIL